MHFCRLTSPPTLPFYGRSSISCNRTVSLCFGRKQLSGVCLGKGDVLGMEDGFGMAAVSVSWGAAWSPSVHWEWSEARASLK